MRYLTFTRRRNPPPRLPARRAPALLMGVVLLCVAGCASGQSGTAAVPAATNVVAGSSASHAGSSEAVAPPAPAGPETVLKVCSLLTSAEIKAIIGTDSGGIGNSSTCEWINEDNEYSVTVEIGDPGTSVGGHLPDPMPGSKIENGPDGIRFSSGNVAEFLIGDRACQVQVVTDVTNDSDRQTQVRLIGLLRGRVTA